MKRLVFVAAVVVFLSVSLPAKSILAVLSADNPLYRKILDNFKAVAGATVTEFVMTETSVPADRIASADMVFAIGDKAFRAVKSGGKQVIFCMVFMNSSNHDGKSSGVTLVIPAETKLNRIKEFLPGSKSMGVIYTPESKVEFDSLSSKAGVLMAFDYDYADIGSQAGALAASGKAGVFEYPKKSYYRNQRGHSIGNRRGAFAGRAV